MQKHLFLLFFLASIIFAYSCKADVGQPQISSATTADADEQINEPSEAYLDTRSLRDELVEKIIADNYRISEEKLDEHLALYVLDPEEWGGQSIQLYTKRTQRRS